MAIARALAKQPGIILADEPTGNLDSKSGAEVLDLLHALAADGATLVLITHDVYIADGFPRRILMRDGEIVGDERRTVARRGSPPIPGEIVGDGRRKRMRGNIPPVAGETVEDEWR